MKNLLILMIVCILISGCRTTEKKAKGWAYDNKDKLAEWCADCFPVKPSEVIQGETVYLPGDTLIKKDTVTRQADCPDGSKADCPPCEDKIIRIPMLRVDTLKIRDTAYEAVLTNERDKYREELNKMTESRDKYRKWFWILVGVVGVYVLIRIKKPL